MTQPRSKQLILAAMMAALGNILSFLSIQLAPFMPNIPVGPIQVSLALDLSHLATFIAALMGGPLVGGLTGLVGGSIAAFEFGFSQGNIITGFGLPLGKALTGVAAGFLFSRIVPESTGKGVLGTALSYIPEAVLTLLLFRFLLPLYISMDLVGMFTLLGVQIVIKAFFEMAILGFLLVSINKNSGFQSYKNNYFN